MIRKASWRAVHLILAAGSGFALSIVLSMAFDEGAVTLASHKTVPKNGIISKSGRYFLDKDLVVNRNIGIQVKANNVDLDLRGYAIRFGSATPKSGNFGIYFSRKSGITIRNGSISGWWFGLHASDGKELVISDLEIENIGYIGIHVSTSLDVRISRNRLSELRHDIPREADAYVIGMNIQAERCDIVDNVVDDQFGGYVGFEKGIETVHILFPAGSTRECIVARNRITADRLSFSTYGIWIGQEVDIVLTHNEIENQRYAITIDDRARAVVAFNRLSVTPSNASFSELPVEIAKLDSTAIYSNSMDICVVFNEINNFTRPFTLTNGGVVGTNRIAEDAK